MKFLLNGGVAFGNLADIAPERFGDNAKVAFEFFHLLGVHGSSVYSLLAKNVTQSLPLECLGCTLFPRSNAHVAQDSNDRDRVYLYHHRYAICHKL